MCLFEEEYNDYFAVGNPNVMQSWPYSYELGALRWDWGSRRSSGGVAALWSDLIKTNSENENETS